MRCVWGWVGGWVCVGVARTCIENTFYEVRERIALT